MGLLYFLIEEHKTKVMKSDMDIVVVYTNIC
jgi:hypothetical protein